MPSDLREFYRVLELSPGASLDEIKRSYRRLLQQWHPDRYKPGSVMQTTAEDVTKELNEAYHQLCRKKRYLEFRPKPAPPPEVDAPPATSASFEHARKTYAHAAEPPREHSHAAPPPAAAEPPPPKPPVRERKKTPRAPRRRFGWRALFLVAATAASVLVGFAVRAWFASNSEPERWARVSSASWTEPKNIPSLPETKPKSGAPGNPASSMSVASRAREAAAVAPATPFTGIDDALAHTEHAAWNFDSRRAPLFAPPASVALVQADPPSAASVSPRPPWTASLRPAVAAPKTVASARVFEIPRSLLDTFMPGDTKTRVVAVQGAPDDAGENVFRYGTSLVYFSGGRVTHWNEGWPALRVSLLPSFDLSGAATFGVGSTREEVVRVQGPPTQTAANAYYYGASAVYFDRAWVIGWSEVDRPLHVRVGPIAPDGRLAVTPSF